MTTKEIKEAMTKPLTINGKVMTIPCDIKIGNDWGNLRKYKDI